MNKSRVYCTVRQVTQRKTNIVYYQIHMESRKILMNLFACRNRDAAIGNGAENTTGGRRG